MYNTIVQIFSVTNGSTTEYLPFNYKIRDILSNKLELISWTSPMSTLNSYVIFFNFRL